MILITSTGELLLYFTVVFFSFHIKKKKVMQDRFCVVFVWPYLNCRIAFSNGLN